MWVAVVDWVAVFDCVAAAELAVAYVESVTMNQRGRKYEFLTAASDVIGLACVPINYVIEERYQPAIAS